MKNDDFDKELKATFQNMRRARSINLNMNKAEHEEHFRIIDQHKTYRIQEELTYLTEYKSRVAQENKRLMRKDGAKTREHKPVFGMDDRFNGNKLNITTQKNVRAQHKITMANLREAERDDLDKFYTRVENRNAERGHATHDFNKTTNRRSGVDRRTQTRTGPKR